MTRSSLAGRVAVGLGLIAILSAAVTAIAQTFLRNPLVAALAGVLAAGQLGLNPNMGDDLLMPSFIAIIVGGVGSLTGTLLGGLLIGVAGALTTVFLPSASEAVIYVIMLVVLVTRPRGLMGEEGMLA